MSPTKTLGSVAADASLTRLAVEAGSSLRGQRLARRLSLRDVALRAGIAASTLHRLEAGEPATLGTYARVALALGSRPALTFETGRAERQHRGRSDEDFVHAAMGELEARHLGALGYRVAIDEPYQHYQFAGRADVVAWDANRRALLHIENRTQFPNVQEAAGAFNAKRAYLPAVLANRFEIGGGWRSVVHVLVGLWSSEVLHLARLRRSTIAAICPDPIHLFAGWWRGEPTDRGSASIFVVLDPDYRIGRSRRYIDLDTAQRVDPRYRDYADVARRLRAR